MQKTEDYKRKLLTKDDLIRRLSQNTAQKMILSAEGFECVKKGSNTFVITPSDDYIRIEKMKYYRYLSVIIDRALYDLKKHLREKGVRIITDDEKITVAKSHERYYVPPIEYFFDEYKSDEFLKSIDLARLNVFIDLVTGRILR